MKYSSQLLQSENYVVILQTKRNSSVTTTVSWQEKKEFKETDKWQEVIVYSLQIIQPNKIPQVLFLLGEQCICGNAIETQLCKCLYWLIYKFLSNQTAASCLLSSPRPCVQSLCQWYELASVGKPSMNSSSSENIDLNFREKFLQTAQRYTFFEALSDVMKIVSAEQRSENCCERVCKIQTLCFCYSTNSQLQKCKS